MYTHDTELHIRNPQSFLIRGFYLISSRHLIVFFFFWERINLAARVYASGGDFVESNK